MKVAALVGLPLTIVALVVAWTQVQAQVVDGIGATSGGEQSLIASFVPMFMIFGAIFCIVAAGLALVAYSRR